MQDIGIGVQVFHNDIPGALRCLRKLWRQDDPKAELNRRRKAPTRRLRKLEKRERAVKRRRKQRFY